jgi:hypothetical protein
MEADGDDGADGASGEYKVSEVVKTVRTCQNSLGQNGTCLGLLLLLVGLNGDGFGGQAFMEHYTALTVGLNVHTGQRSMTKNITCYNCNKTGHFKLDCWAKGKGKEGQRPAGKGRRGPANATKPTTNAAAVTPPPPVNFAFTSAASTPHGQ